MERIAAATTPTADGRRGRVFRGTVHAQLVALDAGTGDLLWKAQVGDNNLGYHITGAPIGVDGRVITGVSGGEQGCRCYVNAST